MKTMLNLDDDLVRAVKARAAAEGDTFTRLVERALRHYLAEPAPRDRRFRIELLVKGGQPVADVNLDDRDALYERMDGRD